MKGHVAAAAVAFASLAREGIRPPGDVLLALTADEEVGDDFGASWLAREHPDKVRAPFGLNEGGGDRCVFGGRRYYLCAVAEKATAPFKLRLRGRSGHASDPHAADNALLKAGPVLDALARLEPPRSLIPEVKAFLETVLGDVPPVEEALDRAGALHPLAAQLIAPLPRPRLPDHDRGLEEAERHPRLVRDRGRLRVASRPGACRDGGAPRSGVPGEWGASGSSPSTSAGRAPTLDTALARARRLGR
jgi:hypothetical protein